MAFNEESRRVDELTTNMAKKDQIHAEELGAEAKELADYEVARTSELEELEKLEADCNEMQSQ